MTHLRKAMLEELQRRNLSPITTRLYLRAVEEFAQYYNKLPDRLGRKHIRQYQAHLFTDRKLDAISVAQQLSALRFFYLKTLKRPWMIEDMVIPKRPIRLPEVLSPKEVEQLIQGAASPLHRIWLLILYATGMRREELVQLKVRDIDSDRMFNPHSSGEGQEGSRRHAQSETAGGTSPILAFGEPQAENLPVPQQRRSSQRRCPHDIQKRMGRRAPSRYPSRARQTRPPAHPAALLRYPPARIRRRLAYYSTLAGPCRSADDHPLPASVGTAP